MVFFYNQEVCDRKARLQRLQEDGVRIPRKCPSQARYKQHLINQGYPEVYAGIYIMFSGRSSGNSGFLVNKNLDGEIDQDRSKGQNVLLGV